MDFTRTPAPAENNGSYGAHFWLNRKPALNQLPSLAEVEESVFSANGNEGQYVYIVPERVWLPWLGRLRGETPRPWVLTLRVTTESGGSSTRGSTT